MCIYYTISICGMYMFSTSAISKCYTISSMLKMYWQKKWRIIDSILTELEFYNFVLLL